MSDPSHKPQDTPESYAGMVGALNSALEVFCSNNEKTFDGVLTKIMLPVAKAMGVSRIFVTRLVEKDGEDCLMRVFQWDKNNRGSTIKGSELLPEREFVTEWAGALRHGVCLNRRLADATGDERTLMDRFGLKSITIAPVFVREEFWGDVVFEDHEVERYYTGDSMSLILSYARLFVNAIIRNDMEIEMVRQNDINKRIESNILRLESESEKIYYDPLTGIYNRRFFDENLSRVINTLSRSTDVLSLMMVDIDYFKNYNDSFGHAAGDDCLKTIAEILSDNTTRADDFVVRYGGDEFAIVLPNTEESGARLIAEKILSSLDSCVMHRGNNGEEIVVSVSIGVTTGIVRPRNRADDFVLRADELLYKSKQDGRNRYTFGRL